MSQFTAPRNLRRPAGVFLIGFMGCGKTTVGESLSQRLGWKFEDLDSRIQARQGCTIPEIFSNHGEARFRQIEHEALLQLVDEMLLQPSVAALGGGTFVPSENRSVLHDTGWPTVFLDAPLEDLWERCRAAQERPLAKDQNQFRQLYEGRRSFYMEAAVRIDTAGKNVELVTAEIAAWLESPPKER